MKNIINKIKLLIKYKNTGEHMELKLNRKYKDTLFRKVFNNKKDLLSLYNALNNTNHTDDGLITINTIEDAIYIGYKNDISFIINSELNLYEHQSSINYNMPVRGLIYFAELYKGYIEQNNLLIYNEKLVELPFPKYVVFYNGTDDEPEEQELRLSDAFSKLYKEKNMTDINNTNINNTDINNTSIIDSDDNQNSAKKDDNKPCLEVIVNMLNINYGCNRELMEKCQKLMEYSKFIALVREKSALLAGTYIKEMKPVNKKEIFAEAVSLAINEAIRNNVLKDILSKNKAEVADMLLTEFDEKAYIEGVKKQSYEDGMAEGEARGEARGEKIGEARGEKIGEAKLAELVIKLKESGRIDELTKITDNKELEKLYKEFNM